MGEFYRLRKVLLQIKVWYWVVLLFLTGHLPDLDYLGRVLPDPEPVIYPPADDPDNLVIHFQHPCLLLFYDTHFLIYKKAAELLFLLHS